MRRHANLKRVTGKFAHVMISNPGIPFKRSRSYRRRSKEHGSTVEHDVLVTGNVKKLKVFETFIFKSNHKTNINYSCILKLQKNKFGRLRKIPAKIYNPA